MANYKDNPRTSTITFRLTDSEKRQLQDIANKQTNNRVSELVWQIVKQYLEEKA
jgi:predicted transcriptional regulator